MPRRAGVNAADLDYLAALADGLAATSRDREADEARALGVQMQRLVAGLHDCLAASGRLAEERDFLLARCREAGGWRADALRSTGTSSNALVAHAFGGPEPRLDEYPRDPADLAACHRAARQLPAHLRARAEAILPSYRLVVAGRYPLDEMDALLAAETAG